jgi:hypothetical protein
VGDEGTRERPAFKPMRLFPSRVMVRLAPSASLQKELGGCAAGRADGHENTDSPRQSGAFVDHQIRFMILKLV